MIMLLLLFKNSDSADIYSAGEDDRTAVGKQSCKYIIQHLRRESFSEITQNLLHVLHEKLILKKYILDKFILNLF